jgi:hypothetical protein
VHPPGDVGEYVGILVGAAEGRIVGTLVGAEDGFGGPHAVAFALSISVLRSSCEK